MLSTIATPINVDAEGIFAHGVNEALNMLKLRQIGFADMVILNKIDLVRPEVAWD